MIDDIRRLKNYSTRLTTVVNELASLEDGVNVDYSDVVTDIGFHVNMLEQRRERLQRRGRTQ